MELLGLGFIGAVLLLIALTIFKKMNNSNELPKANLKLVKEDQDLQQKEKEINDTISKTQSDLLKIADEQASSKNPEDFWKKN
jgi:uncharacterized membrane protein YhiD involved in acid resistance